jgi:lactate permease
MAGAQRETPPYAMGYLLALTPIAVVLILMTGRRWGAHKAGPGGWLVALTIAALWFGLTPEVFNVSQLKGLLLSAFVLAVMWPALFLFHWLNLGGGITAVAATLKRAIPDPGLCAFVMAWALSAVLEGIAGFGLPVAIVSPMLVAVGIAPARAVAAVAVGHCWAVTFGSMGIIFETLVAITGIAAADLVGWSGLLLGAACAGSGLGAAFILGQQRHWPAIVLTAAVMGAGQYALAALGLVPLSCMLAGLAGVGLLSLFWRSTEKPGAGELLVKPGMRLREPLLCYGSLAVLMAVLTLSAPLRLATGSVAWKASFPEVKTRLGSVTHAETGPAFRLFTHPGTLITLVALGAIAASLGSNPGEGLRRLRHTAMATWNSGGLTSLGIVSMVGISTLMEHCGMSLLLAQGISRLLGSVYPLASPLVGVLGSFATGSNNNSNIMFGPLQKNAALLLDIAPAILVAAQTAGGSIGSLLAPAKIVVGCSTVGMVGQEGVVLRRTIPYGILIGLGLGVLTLICAAAFS